MCFSRDSISRLFWIVLNFKENCEIDPLKRRRHGILLPPLKWPSRGKLWSRGLGSICIPRATAVLLRLLNQIDLPFEELILELHALEFQRNSLLDFGLTDAALIQAALHQHAWCR